MKRALSVLLVMLFAVPVFSQLPVIKNFDKQLSRDDAHIVIQPPSGKTWTITHGTFILAKPPEGTSVSIYYQGSDDPADLTHLIHHQLFTVRQPTGRGWDENRIPLAWVPIVGGYVMHPVFGQIRGMSEPIVLNYPNKIVIHMHRLFTESNTPLNSWTRFTVIESDLPSPLTQ